MIPKLIKLPESMLLEITERAERKSQQTGEQPNVSSSIRELLRLGLEVEKKSIPTPAKDGDE